MNNPLGVSPTKGKQGTTQGKEKILLHLDRCKFIITWIYTLTGVNLS